MFSREERGDGPGRRGRVVKVWETSERRGGVDTRKSRVAEMGKREEKRREEAERLAGDTGTSIIHVVCLLHLLPPFVVFHDLRSL